MDIVIKSYSEEALEDRDYRDCLEIHIDGEEVFEVHDGEPEDSNLSRDFNDCLNIGSLLRVAHAAGLAGEELNITYEDLEE